MIPAFLALRQNEPPSRGRTPWLDGCQLPPSKIGITLRSPKLHDKRKVMLQDELVKHVHRCVTRTVSSNISRREARLRKRIQNPLCTSDRIERLFGLLSANILHEITQIQRTGWDHAHSLPHCSDECTSHWSRWRELTGDILLMH